MFYVVIRDFVDLQDENHVYHIGDKYPRKGKITKSRVEELSSVKNLIGEPLIKEGDDLERNDNSSNS